MLALQTLIDTECEALRRLVVLMAQEQAALTAANPAPLEGLAEEKSAIIRQLNEFDGQRRALIGATSEADGRQRMQDWLAANPQASSIAEGWQTLLDLARAARTANELNGQLVAEHLNRTAQALDVLTAHQANSGLYGSNGLSNPLTGSRIIDAA